MPLRAIHIGYRGVKLEVVGVVATDKRFPSNI